MVTAVLEGAADAATFRRWMRAFDAHSLLSRVATITRSADADSRRHLHRFQRQRLREIRLLRDEPYRRESSSHEETLLRLWRAVFPSTTLEARVSEQWKLLGFQGTDPATDFRGMGMLGLRTLVYAAEEHREVFRRIVSVQAERKERDYPVAVAGINITQLLYELLEVDREDGEGQVIYVVLNHPHAFEELWIIALQVLDNTWDDLQASYMDFPRVIAAVRKRMADVLGTNPPTLDQWLRAATWKGSQLPALGSGLSLAVDDAEVIEAPPLKTVRAAVTAEMTTFVAQRPLAALQAGTVFRTSRRDKSSLPFCACRLVGEVLFYAPVASDEMPMEFPFQVPVSEWTDVVVHSPNSSGTSSPAVKRKGGEDVPFSFSLLLLDGKVLELQAQNREEFVLWTDGLRYTLSGKLEHPETLEDLKSLITLELGVRLLEIDGLEIPNEPPPVPQLPDNYNFCTQ